MTEKEWDKLLKIRTTGRDDSRSDQYRFPYEPTPYCVLERLASSGYISKKNTLLDYGSGKGRVGFFLSWQTRCRSIGIEYDERIFGGLTDNLTKAVSGGLVRACCASAETFTVPAEADRFYFFNPFSVEILQKTMGKILRYEYLAWLMTVDELTFVDEIDCRDLFEGEDKRERIMIFEML